MKQPQKNHETALHIKQLEQEQKTILQELAELRETFKLKIDGDIGEGDPVGAERGKAMSLIHLKERRLQTIDQALQELKQGSYGICEKCGKSIDPDRLTILPETTFCIDCQRIVEKQRHMTLA